MRLKRDNCALRRNGPKSGSFKARRLKNNLPLGVLRKRSIKKPSKNQERKSISEDIDKFCFGKHKAAIFVSLPELEEINIDIDIDSSSIDNIKVKIESEN